MSDTLDQLNVSLETHLVDTLRQLLPVLPPKHQAQLTPYLSPQRRDKISYALLQSISQWTRSTSGARALRSHSPSLNPQDYTMIALLAGVTTSPERHFAPYEPPKDPEQLAQERKKERKAIAAIINGVFSIIGTGVAAWWGSERTGWKNEWRILFAFFATAIVALAEIVLYIIWQHRQDTAPKPKKRYIRVKNQEDTVAVEPPQSDTDSGNATRDHLRKRRIHHSNM
ncbi:vacuolar h+-atpase assembly protein [Moniliophthora roreri MCA 2997]|uniref:Vacuolar h+-atpase assembly protein n=2 Tax=Moniliophthora roreri TaxID=221103 RepID=V2Z166_MONRO|nr:vacuolar h+-atpase assembly protein [Moniliophthora roreri MCA 2997]KAI3600352.1 vacuolar h+-atpase assembly protein [Moniliophthora roreri]